VTPYLAVGEASRAIDWYERAFGAKVVTSTPGPGGKVMHAELKIGDSSVFLSDIFPGSDLKDPRESGPSVNMHFYSKQIDRVWKRAVEAGAKVTMPIDNQFWGERYGRVLDPFGHSWAMSYPAKMSAAEKKQKEQDAMASMSGGDGPESWSSNP